MILLKLLRYNVKTNFIINYEQIAWNDVLIFDVEDIGIADAIRDRGTFSATCALGEYVPETTFKIFVINAGWSFRAVWNIVSVKAYFFQFRQNKIRY